MVGKEAHTRGEKDPALLPQSLNEPLSARPLFVPDFRLALGSCLHNCLDDDCGQGSVCQLLRRLRQENDFIQKFRASQNNVLRFHLQMPLHLASRGGAHFVVLTYKKTGGGGF